MSEFFFTFATLLWLSSLLLCHGSSPSSTFIALGVDVVRRIIGVDLFRVFSPLHLLELFNIHPRFDIMNLTPVPTPDSVQFASYLHTSIQLPSPSWDSYKLSCTPNQLVSEPRIPALAKLELNSSRHS